MQNRAGSTGTQPGSEERDCCVYKRDMRRKGPLWRFYDTPYGDKTSTLATLRQITTTDEQEERWGKINTTANEQPATGSNRLTRKCELNKWACWRKSSPRNDKLIHMSLQTHMTCFLLWNTKGDILNNVLVALFHEITMNDHWSFSKDKKAPIKVWQ